MTKKILIADDDAGVIHLLEKFLTDKGYTVISTNNGLDALVLIKKEVPDLVMLDVMMPEINGYDVCFEIKFDDKYRHIPIILLTVRNRELNIDVGKKARIEYVKKPAEPAKILTIIERMLEGK